MKQNLFHYAFAAFGLVAISASASTTPTDAAPSLKSTFETANQITAKNLASAPIASKAIERSTRAGSSKMKPSSATIYRWIENEWALSENYVYTYDARGNVLSQTNDSIKMVYTYDSIVTDKPVRQEVFCLIDNEWVSQGGLRTDVIRNDKGNITKVSYNQFYGEMEEPITEYTVTYGSDDKASAMSLYDGQVNFSNLKWERTNGQLLMSFDEMQNLSPDLVCKGDNRISSCKLSSPEIQQSFTLAVTYTDQLGSYKITAKMLIIPVGTITHTVLDENGSYKNEDIESDYNETETVIYDSFGLVKEATTSVTENNETKTSLVKGEITYNSTTGFPTEYTCQSKGMEETELVNSQRALFGTYIDPAGISTPVADQNSNPVFYNLQGQKIDTSNLTPGIYVRRQGGTATKVLIKK